MFHLRYRMGCTQCLVTDGVYRMIAVVSDSERLSDEVAQETLDDPAFLETCPYCGGCNWTYWDIATTTGPGEPIVLNPQGRGEVFEVLIRIDKKTGKIQHGLRGDISNMEVFDGGMEYVRRQLDEEFKNQVSEDTPLFDDQDFFGAISEFHVQVAFTYHLRRFAHTFIVHSQISKRQVIDNLEGFTRTYRPRVLTAVGTNYGQFAVRPPLGLGVLGGFGA